jgi:hypothetical protein
MAECPEWWNAMQPELKTALDPLERRLKARFPLNLGVRYRVLSGNPTVIGIGRTINMSSRGLLIASEEPGIPAGTQLQLTLDWPFLLHGVTPLQLIVSCRVTRCQSEEFAVRLDQYLFRTKKR